MTKSTLLAGAALVSTNKTIPPVWDGKVFDKNIKKLQSVLGTDSPTLVLLAEAAVQALLHAYHHGDPVYCQRLYDALGGTKGAVRTESMKVWFGLMGPITAKTNKEGQRVWAMKKDWSVDKDSKFRLQDAVNQPFWEFMGPEKVKDFSFNGALATLKSLIKRVDTSVEKGTFKGDADATKASLTAVYSFAEAQAKKLTPKQRGEEDATAEVLLAAANGNTVTEGAQVPSSMVN